MWKPDIPDSPSLSQNTPEVSHSDNSECRSDWRWTSLQPRKPLKLTAAWTGKSSIIFMGVLKSPKYHGYLKTSSNSPGPHGFFSSPPLSCIMSTTVLRPRLFSGKDVNAFTMVPMLDDLSLKAAGGVFMCPFGKGTGENQLWGWKSFAHWFHSTITYSVSIFYVAISICFSEVGNVSAMRWS